MVMRVIVICAMPVSIRIIVGMRCVVIVRMLMVRALGVMIVRMLRRRQRFGFECAKRS